MCRRGPTQLYLGHEVRTTKEPKELMLTSPETPERTHYMFGGLIRGFEGFNQVKIVRTIGVSREDPNTSYPCVEGVQYNLIWAMK